MDLDTLFYNPNPIRQVQGCFPFHSNPNPNPNPIRMDLDTLFCNNLLYIYILNKFIIHNMVMVMVIVQISKKK